MDVPSPIELQFYDDYLVFYASKRYLNRKTTCKQISTVNYSEITRCVLRSESNKFCLYGNIHNVFYNYKEDGSVASDPSREYRIEKGSIIFSLDYDSKIDLKKEIESHSILNVIVEDS